MFFVFVVWRVTLGDDKTTLKSFVVTEPSATAYAENGELYVLTNEMADDISTPILRLTDEEAPEGQFIAYGFYYIPETKEFQITVRYNDTTEATLGDFNFFAYTVDTSGEQMEESEDGQRLHFGYPIGEVLSPTYNSDVKEKMFYNFEKLVFKGVDIDENTNVVVSLCYGDAPEYLIKMKMADSLCLYVEQAAYAQFEMALYDLPEEELTAENIRNLYRQVGENYGFDSYGFDDRDFITVTHYFTSPLYILRYVVSNDAALQLYQLEQEQAGTGLARLEAHLATEEYYFLAFLDSAGLQSPFAPGRLQTVRKLFEEILG